ncbi:MAG: sulfite exporter TauE/SafE family protein [Clostridia bacterium]|nr:sulfite exporter TauE/SafE family protein [Clostridia bacterium]
MEFIWYVFAGLLGGVLGGMGMGGGTVLIPLLSIFYCVSQHTAQASNLISFIPMAIVALIIHLRNGLVEFKKIMFIILPGVITCIVGCYLARAISGDLLKRLFGGFLLLLSIFQFVTEIKKVKR